MLTIDGRSHKDYRPRREDACGAVSALSERICKDELLRQDCTYLFWYRETYFIFEIIRHKVKNDVKPHTIRNKQYTNYKNHIKIIECAVTMLVRVTLG